MLDRNCISGFRSFQRGRNVAPSWIDADSLEKHIEIRAEKQRMGAPVIVGDGAYVSVRVAAEKTGFSRGYIYRLVRQGSISSKRPAKKTGLLIYLNDLKKFKKKYT
ncbi:MAG: hypothetical protein ABFS56_29095 [Pseudomonadota bacterium]